MIDYPYYLYDTFNHYHGIGFYESWSYSPPAVAPGGAQAYYRTLLGVGI